MVEFPKESQFILAFPSIGDYGTTHECEPDNWAEIQLALQRFDFAVNKEFTNEFTFSGVAGTIIKLLFDTYGSSAQMTMTMNKRQSDWTYELFHTFTADFSTYIWDTKTHITFKQSSLEKDLEANRGTEYELSMPDTIHLSYTGVDTVRTNTIKAFPASMPLVYPNVGYVVRGFRSEAQSSNYFEFDSTSFYPDYFFAKCVSNNIALIRSRIGVLYIDVAGTGLSNLELRLYVANIGLGNTIIRTWSNPTVTVALGITSIAFSDGTEYEDAVNLANGEFLFLALTGTNLLGKTVTLISGTTQMSIVSTETSPYDGLEVRAVTHEWALAQVLAQINPAFTLTYSLPVNGDEPYSTLLVPAPSLARQTIQKLTVSFDSLIKSLKLLYGADFRVSGTVVTVDVASSFFSETKAMSVIPIDKPTFSSDMEHVYNRVTVGYETGDKVENGMSEFNCKNTFLLNEKATGTLELIHPFCASMYTIEQYLRDKGDDSAKTDSKDTDVFLFAVSEYTTVATLYKSYTTSNITASAYNLPLSPMRILKVNGAYLGVSKYLQTPEATFLSSDRSAALESRLPYESLTVKESNGGETEPLGVAMATPLFLPLKVDLATGLKLWSMSTISSNLYNYFEFTDLKTNLVHQFYIKDISLRLTKINRQSWVGIYKGIYGD